jgi:hypothetical protein
MLELGEVISLIGGRDYIHGVPTANFSGPFLLTHHFANLKLIKLGHARISIWAEEECPVTNPQNRGSAPGRAQPDDLRPGSFKSGHKKQGGRERGTPNAFSTDYKKAIVEAAYRIGMDGNGKNGVVGYLQWLAEYHPPSFALLLTSVLQWEFLPGTEEPRRTIDEDELNEQMREYIGLADKAKPKRPWRWTGQDFPVGSLMESATEDPEGFCKLLVAAFLRSPTARDRRRAWEHSQTVRDRRRC